MDALWLALAFLLGLGARHLGLPALVGYLIAGFLLNALGQHDTPLLAHLAHAGVLLLLFSVGLKLKLKSLIRPDVWGGGGLHLMVSALGLGFAFWLVSGLALAQALVLAATLSFSSTVLAAKVLEEKAELRAFHGRLAIGILIIQDLAALALMALAGAATPTWWSFLIFMLPALQPLIEKVLDWSGHDELLVLFGLALTLVIGGLGFEQIGLSPELGALLLGALLAGHSRSMELSRALWSLKEVLLVGFFLEIGLLGWPTLATLGWAKRIATVQLRRHGFQGLIGAVSSYPEEADVLKAAGADMTFLAFNEVGVGLAEHVWEALEERSQAV